MGKGKGNFLRRAFKSRIFSPLIEFRGIDYKKILELKRFLQTKVKVKLAFIHTVALVKTNLSRHNITSYIFKKHNFI
jgi:hypothetical protein